MKNAIAVALALGFAVPAVHAQSVWDVLTGKKRDPQTLPAQQPGGGVVGQAQANGTAAKQSVDIASVDLQAARLFVAGLYDLSTRTFDKHRAVALLNQAQEAVTQAELQLGDLTSLAQGSAADPLGRARQTMVDVQGDLRGLTGAINSGSPDANRIKSLYQSIDSASHDLESAAQAMNVDTKLNTP